MPLDEDARSLANLQHTALRLAAPGKGLLASDESTGTIGKRLERSGIANTEEHRRQYRELFYTAPLGSAISGAILFTEALAQRAADGTAFVDCLLRQGVLPGCKVDEGLVPMEGREGETTTRGLATLAARCDQYYRQGARFAKWRAALRVGPGLPSSASIEANAEQLAEYAAVSQACGLVPIVEPELLIDGDHSAAAAAEAGTRVLSRTVAALWARNVSLEAALLKPQMAVPGVAYAGQRPGPEGVADLTLAMLRRCVPPALPGIVFLSGGQSEEEATINLNAINAAGRSAGAPWALSFSFGRGLQASVLKLWAEDRADAARCRAMAAALARANGEAALGRYRAPHPSLDAGSGSGSGAGLHEDFRGWRTDV